MKKYSFIFLEIFSLCHKLDQIPKQFVLKFSNTNHLQKKMLLINKMV